MNETFTIKRTYLQSKKFSKLILIFIVAAVTASVSFLVLKALYDPNVPFLKTEAGANWILYPFTPELMSRTDNYVNLTSRFSKNFKPGVIHSNVYLNIKAHKKFRIWINGMLLSVNTKEINWKTKQGIEISSFLKQGTNSIIIEVKNNYGPPALWLYSRGMENEIKSDTNWTVSISDSPPVSAILANDCFLHPISSQFVSPLEGLCKKLPMLILFFLISSMAFWLHNYKQKNTKFNTSRSQRFLAFTPKRVLIICIILWIIGFINNASKISFDNMGFDINGHIHYVQYLLDNKSVPLANEGWEAYQPPLFYLVSAIIVSLSRLFLAPNLAWSSLKIIPFLCGIGQI
ncbi:MAG: hypothetical protein WCE45_08020, partial [Sedimentisphaerales bacterium]